MNRRPGPLAVTGERVVTSEAGFNPTWQRHVAAYALCAHFLPRGPVLDLGCGTGHSHHLLAPRETIGVDTDPEALVGQDRPTAVADMRDLPFADHSFPGALAVQSIEHVPEPDRALAEISRVLAPGGVAVLVTPNALTFSLEGEVIDPYHHLELTGEELRALCERHFLEVRLHGLFGSPRYLALVERERAQLRRRLRADPLRLRRLLPRRVRQRLYDRALRRARGASNPIAERITPADFTLGDEPLAEALDLVAVCGAG
jgi:SAM-dependent methyltransferase